jgi:hypothetical protein
MADHTITKFHSSPSNDCLLEQHLIEYWHHIREEHFRFNRRTIWSSYDPYLTVLGDNPPVRFPIHHHYRDMWNKPTCMYFEPTSYSTSPPRIVFAAIYEAWRHDCGEYWNPEYGHFMANPVRIAEQGPKTLGEIIEIHKEICALGKEHEPDDGKYGMHKSYLQVLLVCDKRPTFSKEDDGYVSLKKVAEEQTVLVVRTRAPGNISIGEMATHALPAERSDVGDLDVLRVPLSIAVKHMIALETYMGESQGKNPNRFDTELLTLETPLGFNSIFTYHPAMWGAAMAEMARKHGNCSMVPWRWPAMRIAEGVSGQPHELEEDHWRHYWKPGYE